MVPNPSRVNAAPPAVLPRRRTPILRPSRHAHDEARHKQHQEDEEQNLSDAGGGRGDAAEAEGGRDDGHDKENQSPAKHSRLLKSRSLKQRFAVGRVPAQTGNIQASAPPARARSYCCSAKRQLASLL